MESVDGQHDGGPFESFESHDGSVEHVVAGPEGRPVGVLTAALLLDLHGVPVAGGEQGDVQWFPAVFEQVHGFVAGGVEHSVGRAFDVPDRRPGAASWGGLVGDQFTERGGDLAGVAQVLVEPNLGEVDGWSPAVRSVR